MPAPALEPVQAFPLQLRWADLDLLGHVNNVRYVEYAQEARIKFITLLDATGVLPRRPMVVARQEVDHVRVLELTPEPVQVRVQLAAVGRSSITVDQVVEDAPGGAGHVYARVRSVVVGFDAAAGRSRPLEEAERDALVALVVPADAAPAGAPAGSAATPGGTTGG